MNEQRKQILDMLAEGKITADEAERLIAALEENEAATSPPPPKGKLKYLRVLVDDPGDSTKVNVRIPVQLLRAGVKLASLVPDRALDQANGELERHGVPIDLKQLKPEQIEELIDQLGDMTIEVQDNDSKVHVFFE
jgi:SHOCT-like protein